MWVRLAVLGALSGGLSWGALALLDALGIDFNPVGRDGLLVIMPLSTVPGLVFGLAFGAVLLVVRRVGAGRAALYVLAAVLGYLAAYHAALYGVLWLGQNQGNDPGVPAWVVGGALGGLAGTLVLGLASKLLLSVRAARALGLPVIVGTLTGGLLVLMSLDLDDAGMPKGLLAFFALWQGAYAASLAPLLQRAAAARPGHS